MSQSTAQADGVNTAGGFADSADNNEGLSMMTQIIIGVVVVIGLVLALVAFRPKSKK